MNERATPPGATPSARPSEVPSYLRSEVRVASPAPVPRHAARPAVEGVVAASNAAADAEIRGAAPSARASLGAPVAVEVLWFDQARAGTMRTLACGSALLGAEDVLDRWLEPSDLDPESQRRSDVHRLLARGVPAALDALEEAMLFAFEDGNGAAPVAIVAGELHLPLDEVAHLEAVLAYATPLAPLDARLQESVQQATAAMTNRRPIAPVATHLRIRLEEGLRAIGRIDPACDRAVVEARKYAKRSVLGGPKIRAMLAPKPDGAPAPCYLSEVAAPELPLFQRFRARLLVEVRPQQDPSESHSLALLVVALGRVVSGL